VLQSAQAQMSPSTNNQDESRSEQVTTVCQLCGGSDLTEIEGYDDSRIQICQKWSDAVGNTIRTSAGKFDPEISDEGLRQLFLAIAVWDPWDPYRKLFTMNNRDISLARPMVSLMWKIRKHLQLVPPEDTKANPETMARFHVLLKSRFRRLFARYCRDSPNTVDILPDEFFVKDAVLQYENGYADITTPLSSIWCAAITHEGEEIEVAIKVPRSWEKPKGGLAGIQSLVRETLLWWDLKHPNIVPLYGITLLGQPLRDPGMVIKWMDFGSTRSFLEDSEEVKDLPTRKRKRLVYDWLLQIAKGLEYIHSEEIAHGDLRGPNILIDNDRTVRLTDFGMSLHADGTRGNFGTNLSSNWLWAPPEKLASGKEPHTKAGDMFSFASTCLELYTGADPWDIVPRNEHPKTEGSP